MEGKMDGEFHLPGFRFHPTEEELVGFYLRKKVQGQPFSFDIIGTLDLYRYDPWQLPGLAFIGEREWFYFVPRDTKCAAARRSRLTASGYWKATGSDRPVRNKRLHCIGLKKTLVFYRGKAPRGEKTDWIMNEYRMLDSCPSTKKDVVLCRIYRKPTSQKTLERRAIGERVVSADEKPSSSHSDVSLLNCNHDYKLMNFESKSMDEGLCSVSKSDDEELLDCMAVFNETKLKPLELEVPKMCVGLGDEPVEKREGPVAEGRLGLGFDGRGKSYRCKLDVIPIAGPNIFTSSGVRWICQCFESVSPSSATNRMAANVVAEMEAADRWRYGFETRHIHGPTLLLFLRCPLMRAMPSTNDLHAHAVEYVSISNSCVRHFNLVKSGFVLSENLLKFLYFKTS